MIMKVIVQSVGEGRRGPIRVIADNPTRAGLTTVDQAVGRAREAFGPVGESAKLCDATVSRIEAENAVFRRHGKKNRRPVPDGSFRSALEGTRDPPELPICHCVIFLPDKKAKDR